MSSIVIAIAGGTGSGKTFLTNNLKKKYLREEILIIHQDSYYNDISYMKYNDRIKQNFDHPNAIDIDLIKKHLKELRNGQIIMVPSYDFKSHLRVNNTKKTYKHKIIIIEGILMLHYQKLHKFYSLKVFIDSPEDIRIKRRIKRDMKFRGRTHDSIQSQYKSTVKPMHDKYVTPSKKYADIIISGSNKIDDSVMKIKKKIDVLIT
mgnify:FL=1